MQIGFKYHKCKGFGKLYEYSFKHTHVITKEAKKVKNNIVLERIRA